MKRILKEFFNFFDLKKIKIQEIWKVFLINFFLHKI